MESRKGFTLIELMVVILIVGILTAVAIPIIRGRIDSTKWSEGKTAMGTIATALRAYAAEKATAGNYGKGLPTLEELGFTAGDLQGSYFDISNMRLQKRLTPREPRVSLNIQSRLPHLQGLQLLLR